MVFLITMLINVLTLNIKTCVIIYFYVIDMLIFYTHNNIISRIKLFMTYKFVRKVMVK